MLPNFYIVGAQKSGTTYLHHCLKDHPNIYMPEGESPNFETRYYLKDGVQELKQELSKALKKQIIGIKRPSYLTSKEVARRIKKTTPNAKIIISIRNPVERAISSYYHLMKMGLLPAISPNQGIPHILRHGSYKKYPRSKNILKYGNYAQSIRYYIKLFGKNNVKLIFFNSLTNNSLNTVRDCYRFLQVTDKFTPKSLNSHPMTGVYSTKYIKFLNLQSRYLYSYEPKFRGVKYKEQTPLDLIMLKILRNIDKNLVRFFLDGKKDKINPEIINKLRDYYKKDITELEKLTGEDLSRWDLSTNQILIQNSI